MEQQQQMYLQNPDPQTGLEESMWQLGLVGGGGVGYPERPGDPDCLYFLRTGLCGYGERCKFNHPRNRVAVIGATRAGEEYPKRIDVPLCQYFLKTGTCKFGATCKYHHPKQSGSVTVNAHGYPIRLGEKECSYYVKTGQCKFGITCKFHHPQPAGASVPPAPTFYPAVQSSPVTYPTVANWQVLRPQMLPGPYMQGSYGPMVLSPGFVPVSGWSHYPPPASPIVSHGGQAVQANSMYGGSLQQLSASAPAYLSPYPLASSSSGPVSSSRKEHNFPERPGQPECQFYMRTGDCKFGPTCRYHHPQEWSIPKTTCALSPIGLPLRPGAPKCTYYAQHGICKFGPTCKFDHPIDILSYSPAASSFTDMPVAVYPVKFTIPSLAPSSSSLDLNPEFFTGITLPANSSSGSVGSILSTSISSSRSFAHASSQSSTSLSSSGTVGQGGEAGGSSRLCEDGIPHR